MNLDGPVRVADKAGSGTATVTLSFAAWKEGQVTPTTHSVQVLPAKSGPKAEPVAENLIGTLVHPDRQANVSTLEFSKDGKRLFAAGYPSGIIQLWDWAAKKELRRIETPPGLRPTLNYVALSPDRKLMYVPVESKKVISAEKDGQRVPRVEFSGRIRIWDLSTGDERTSMETPEGASPYYAIVAPDGRHLLTSERVSHSADQPRKGGVWVWDPGTGFRRKLWDGGEYPKVSPDGRTVAFATWDREAKVTILKLVDFVSGTERASLHWPEKDGVMLLGDFSPDGALITTSIMSKKGEKPMILFLDAKTLKERGRFVGEADANAPRVMSSAFSPDAKICALVDGGGKLHIWDVAAGKVVRSFPISAQASTVKFSPDGKQVAVPWMPRSELDKERVRDPDPRDYPQPRITLFDLAGEKQPRTLIAPHGFVGAVEFSPDGKTLAFGTSGGVRLFDLTK